MSEYTFSVSLSKYEYLYSSVKGTFTMCFGLTDRIKTSLKYVQKKK